MIRQLGLHTFTAGAMGLIPGQGTKMPHVMWSGQIYIYIYIYIHIYIYTYIYIHIYILQRLELIP